MTTQNVIYKMDDQSQISAKENADIESKHFLKGYEQCSMEHVKFFAKKMENLSLFEKHYQRFEQYFSNANDIAELGGGSGWASYFIKKMHPNANVHLTDIAEDVVNTHQFWTTLYGCNIDGAYSAKSYDLPFEDESLDLLFCFQAAHHFGKHGATLRELHRVLRPGGIVLYLDEPVCRQWIYPAAHKRVNARLDDDGVPEDLLIYPHLLKIAQDSGFESSIVFAPHAFNRGPLQTMYYFVQMKISFLSRLLPTCGHIVLKKKVG